VGVGALRITETTPAAILQIWDNCATRVADSRHLDDVTTVVAGELYERFSDSLALVRAFFTIPYPALPERQREFALELARSVQLESLLGRTTPVLTLLATRGCVEDWNDTRKSRGHVAIPLLSEDFVASIPMMSRLLKELGLPLTWVQDPGAAVARQTIGAEVGFFCVEDAAITVDELGRKVIAAQEFVSSYSVRSVFAVGGSVLGGGVLIFIFFSRDRVETSNVRAFMPLINLIKSGIVSQCSLSEIFRPAGHGVGAPPPAAGVAGCEQVTSEAATLALLRSALGFMLQGALVDARLLLEESRAAGPPLPAEIGQSLSLLITSLAESTASKERALAHIQLSMLELEAAQAALGTKEARYRELFSSMNDGVVVCEAVDGGRDFVFKEINAAALRIEHLEREDILGRRATAVFPGLEAFGLLEVLRRVWDRGLAEQLPARFYEDSRISGWRENYVYRLPTKEIVVVYRDVSEQVTTHQTLRGALETTERLIDMVPIGLVVVAGDGTIRRANEAAGRVLGARPADLIGREWRRFDAHVQSGGLLPQAEERELVDMQGSAVSVLMSEIALTAQDDEVLHIEAFLDLTERKRLELQLRQAQKLESIGQLAAGIAHEINTPTQYVGDNTRFLHDALGSLFDAARIAIELLRAVKQGDAPRGMVATLEARLEASDLEYLAEEVPRAIEQTLEGVQRIMTIVRSMKEFAHPGSAEKSDGDINRALETTMTVARNEWKYVADVETDLDPTLPLVPCYIGELNQVFLNILVNAAHAIGDVVETSAAEKGKIRISTRSIGDSVEIRFSDTGPGIPESIRHRVFDPFFTTKKEGKGTGQGLAIARRVVVEKHGGTLCFETQEGAGTIFIIRLPLHGTAQKDAA
jgi:PAS domain S-box-containing protein